MKRYLILTLMLAACTHEEPAPSPSPEPAPSTVSDFPEQAWTDALAKAVKETGLDQLQPSDCRGADWVKLLVKVSDFESDTRYKHCPTCRRFDPRAEYIESFDDRTGKPVSSRGLFQMSIESSNGNYACGFANADEIFDPLKAIPCAAKAMAKLVKRDGVLSGYSGGRWQGGSAYWAVLRNPGKLAAIKAAGGCK